MSHPPQSGRYLRIVVLGLPIFLHWSVPALGSAIGGMALLVSGSFSLPIFLWSSLTCIFLIAVHELGHVAAAKAASLEVHGVIFAGTGGWCVTSEPASAARALLLYSGGLVAQAVVLVLTVVALWTFGAPSYLPLNCAVVVLIGGNLLVMLANALPRGDNDGAQIVRLVREGIRKSRGSEVPR